MGIKVKAIERNVSFSKDAEKAKWAYIMQPELYGRLNKDKAIEQAALLSGMPKAVIQASVNAYAEVMTTWATEGHSVPIPGLGTMRFGIRANAVEDVALVSTGLVKSRRVIFTPSSEIKEQLAKASISITCYDRNGKIVKQVSSEDKDDVEDGNDDNKQEPSTPTPGGNTGGSTGSGSDSSDGDHKELD